MLFGVTIAVILILLIGRMLLARSRRREDAGPPPQRTEEQRGRDRRTAGIWVLALLLIPSLLVLASLVT